MPPQAAKPSSGLYQRRLFLIPEIISAQRQRARIGQLGHDATLGLEGLKKRAQELLTLQPPSVLDKKIIPPTGDKHDYMSLSIYFWPNPNTPDGRPYIPRDGLINPEVDQYDRPRLIILEDAVEVLSLTWAFTGEECYAEKAATLLRVWFGETPTRMNPNMLLAQYIPGDASQTTPARFPARWVAGPDGKGVYVSFGGVIEGTSFPLILDAAKLLAGSSAWSKDDQQALERWFTQFADWLLDHQHGKDEAGCPNNHGTWYCTQMASYALLAGRRELADRFLGEETQQRVVQQIEPDGSMPIEYNRAVGLHYVTFALQAFFNLALMGEQVGGDLWNYHSGDGRCLRKALDWAFPYYRGEAWPHQPMVKPFDFQSCIPLLCLAARRYSHPEYLQAARDIQNQVQNHLLHLLYPLEN